MAATVVRRVSVHGVEMKTGPVLDDAHPCFRVIVAPAPVVETVEELTLLMRVPLHVDKPLHLDKRELHVPRVNVAPPVSSIKIWPGAFVVATSVSPAVNVPPHALPTKEAVLWKSLTDLANMMVVFTVKGCEQFICAG
jgi:hypothetical protein